MRRVWRTSGQELAVEDAVVCEDVAALKNYLCDIYGFPVYLQQLLQGGCVLTNDVKLDAHIDLQLVLLTIDGLPPSFNIQRLVELDLANAAQLNRINIIRCLLEAGADTDCCWDHEGMTALMHASKNGHLQVARLLLEASADKDCCDDDGMQH